MPDVDYREIVDMLEACPNPKPSDTKVDFGDFGNPRQYGVPHDTWRPNQLDALRFVRKSVDEKDGSPFFMELPTGSGKSAIPTAIGQKQQVLVLVNSLSLLDQYESKYGFSIVKGMREYLCVNKDSIEYWKSKHSKPPTVADCRFEAMSDCPVADRCPYLVARKQALAADRMACTYPFAMLSKPVQLRHGLLFMDEGHMAAETILALSEIRFSDMFLKDYGLPKFPVMNVECVMTLDIRIQLSNWMKECLRILKSPPRNLFAEDEAKWRNAYSKMYYAFWTINDKHEDFFITAKPDLEQERYMLYGKWTERPKPGLVIKFMSARTIAERIFKYKEKTIVMSATIGEPGPLAEELGMKKYVSKSYGHPVPIAKRPVFDVGFERMTWDNMRQMPALQRMQAVTIGKFIRTLDPQWRGLILTSSYAKAGEIRKYLETTELRDRLYQPPAGQEGLNQRINAFIADDRPGMIVVDPMQGWGHGIDLSHDLARFVIVASVPFGNHQDPYEKARKSFGNANYAWWKSYMHVPQACGRVTRGEQYENGEYWYNVGMLADGSATTGSAMRYYPGWFTEAIQPLNI